jgi:hypothetical protein
MHAKLQLLLLVKDEGASGKDTKKNIICSVRAVVGRHT